MEKWVRRSLKVTLTAGVVGLCAANLANADDTTVVAPGVDSESASSIGDNSILGGNTLSAPIVAPVTGNDVAVAGIGGAVNAENVLAALGVVGAAYAGDCDSDDYVEVSPWVRSSSMSAAGDNSIGSANSASVPVIVPFTDNKGAGTGIGGAVNGEDVSVLAGVVGAAACGGPGDGGPYISEASDDFSTEALPVGNLAGAASNLGGLTDGLPVGDLAGGGLPVPTDLVDQVVSLAGLGGLGGLTDVAGGLPNVGGVGDPVSAVTDVTDTATSTVNTQTTELPQQTATATDTAELQASDPVATTHSVSDDTTVVTPSVSSSSASMVGDNSIGSGNSLSAPIVAPITGNDVSVAGIGGAVNGDDVAVVLGLLGTATALLD